MKEKEKEKEKSNIENDLTLKWLSKCSAKLFLYMINALFNENYPIDDNIEVVPDINEIVDADFTLLILDQLIKIKYHEQEQQFHIELQTANDTSMYRRMFEYGVAAVLNEKEQDTESKVKLRFPKQIVIFIEPNKNIKDFLECQLEFFNPISEKYETYNYSIKTFKIFDKDIDYFSKHHLSLLLPFKISELNKELKSCQDEKAKTELLNRVMIIANEVLSTIKKEYHNHFINFRDYEILLNAIKYISSFFYSKLEPYKKYEETLMVMIKSSLTDEDREQIKQEGKMEGKIEGKMEGMIEGKMEGMIEGKMEGKIEGKMEGMIEGKMEGKQERELEIAQNMLKETIDIQLISKVTGLTIEEIEQLK